MDYGQKDEKILTLKLQHESLGQFQTPTLNSCRFVLVDNFTDQKGPIEKS
jgi:hypothetical protein